MTAEQRIKEHVARLNEANAKYRLGESSGMTDREFDERLKELHELEQRHPESVREDSPTQRIGVEPLTGLTRVRHFVPMLSIANAYTYRQDGFGLPKRTIPLKSDDVKPASFCSIKTRRDFSPTSTVFLRVFSWIPQTSPHVHYQPRQSGR